ncbi:hypothetical protein HMN09_00185400 [Mycena chlorophos]|uniref:non-specific serine/threonine protein kinase n=1 Tax=Mycena chlorophos TaxID=658473 RepID=A0A8H6TNS0_MYCCL|nr:hypothetical protein HMN09_00185400 [Mycena chlorophos]
MSLALNSHDMSDSSSSSGASSLFAFDLASDTEQPEAYVSGGFLPVDVGDLLGPQADSSLRYRVLGKLGHGAYSTVWLARDNVAKTMVAVKTLRASESTNSRELTLLQRLRNSSPDSSAVVQILNAFTAQSPNGIHQILVTELVIPLRELLEMIRLALLSFTNAVLYTEADLHPNNIGAHLRNLDNLTEKEFWKQSGSPSVVPMISMDSERDPGSFPANLTRGIQLGRILERVEPASLQREIQIRIIDLGCGRIAEDTACPRWHTPLPYVAPELAFPMLVENNRDAFWVGDVLGPLRYRVLAKLGHGSYSTVWLARDTTRQTMVAVKAIRASNSVNSREVAILQRLRSSGSEHSPVIELLDDFTALSPNGLHQMLVTELVVPLSDLLGRIRLAVGAVNASNIARQLLEGVAFIHDRGIVHGDLHPGNIGARLCDLDSFSDKNFWYNFGTPNIVPVVSLDSTRDRASTPAYLTADVPLLGIMQQTMPQVLHREPQVRILDLGCARFAEEASCPRWHAPYSYAAPELLFGMIAQKTRDVIWDWRVDIWSMACTIWELLAAERLFTWNEKYIFRNIARLCDGAPAEWLPWIEAKEAAYTDAPWEKERKRLQNRGQKPAAVDATIALLRHMLKINPLDRPSAADLLYDPFLQTDPVQ